MMGEDMAPGVKKGGYLNLTRRRLNCVGPAAIIPTSIEVDVSNLDFGQRIYVSGLSIPSGVSIVDMVSLASSMGCTAQKCWVHKKASWVTCPSLCLPHTMDCFTSAMCCPGGGSAAVQTWRTGVKGVRL